jgi:DnaJ family protein A protein 2
MVVDKTLYDRLEIAQDASQEDIKKKGKKLLIKWHPDKHPNNVETATKKFQEIQEALQILENPEKRKMYDDIGMDYVKGDGPPQMNPGNPFGPGGPFGGGGPFGPGGPFGQGFPFGDMFGGFGGNMPGREERKENIMEKLNVTLEQIYKQETVELKYNHKVYCVKCTGEGSNDGTKTDCKDCGGKGMQVQMIRMGPIIQQSVGPCGTCRGKGKVIQENNKCDVCHGRGDVDKEKTISIPLKNGLGNGIKLQLEGKGHHFKNQKTDLIVLINENPHPIFKRKGNDLYVEISLKLYQALFGFDKVLTHLDGRKLHLHSTGKTNFGSIRKISGEGMTDLRSGVKGDIIIKFNIELPNITNETLIKALTLIDKKESTAEKNLLKETDLVKTLMIDVQNSETFGSKGNDISDSDEEDLKEAEEDGPGECRTQ